MERSINTEEELREYDFVEGHENENKLQESNVSSRTKNFGAAIMLADQGMSDTFLYVFSCYLLCNCILFLLFININFNIYVLNNNIFISENDIAYNTLASLSEKDLEILKISDKTVRDKMLEQFGDLPNQAEHFER